MFGRLRLCSFVYELVFTTFIQVTQVNFHNGFHRGDTIMSIILFIIISIKL